MTGYGSVSEIFQRGRARVRLTVELKTLNSKFLDLQVKIPRLYSSLDLEISKHIKKFLTRGRVEVFVTREILEGTTQALRINLDEAMSIYGALQQVRDSLQIEQKPNLDHLLQHSEWLQMSEVQESLEDEKKFLLQVIDRAISQLRVSREQEGLALKNVLMDHVRSLRAMYLELKDQNEPLIQNLRRRLKQRIQEVMVDVSFDSLRLEQEIAIWVARSDFQEEIDRLGHHLESFSSQLEEGGETGRRLEFVIQEMHRELNTIGSKCSDSLWTTRVISMKSLVERMKEQIQNVE
jgi:uncharacterized protein (TIGR00255 family)